MNKWMQTRTKPCLLRCYWNNPMDGETESEDWARRVLLLFKPWRSETELKRNFECYVDSLEDFVHNCSEAAEEDINRYLGAAESMYDALLSKKADYEEAARQREEMGIHETEVLEVQARTVTLNTVSDGERNMNIGQKDVYDTVLNFVTSENAQRIDNSVQHTPLRMFVSGVGGTGKSFLIDCLANKITYDFSIPGRETQEPAVIIAAPTGFAALAVKGATLHSLLKIEVETKRMSKFRAVPGSRLTELRVLFRNCRLLIIDEISMVSNVMLFKICLRLMEIKGNGEAFGGINVIVLGDLLQLPPVRMSDVFSRLTQKQVQMFFNSLPIDFGVWTELFTYRELTENMRQREDQPFVEFLNRIRVGSMTDADIETLKTQMISLPPLQGGSDTSLSSPALPVAASLEETVDYYLNLRLQDPSVITVFSTLDAVDQFNDLVLTKTASDVVELKAIDTLGTHRSSKKESRIRMYQHLGFRRKDWGNEDTRQRSVKQKPKNSNNENRAGLQENIKVAIGCRIMLRRNLDLAIGLVNGAMGMLTEIVGTPPNVLALKIKFDHIPTEQLVEKVTAQYDISDDQTATRCQFPVVAGFAMTIHKCQGMSASNVITNLADLFGVGMGYVALSRARSLNGIHLMNFNPAKIRANIGAVDEYNRLRNSIGMPNMAMANILPPSAVLYRGRRAVLTTNNIDDESTVPLKLSRQNNKQLSKQSITTAEEDTHSFLFVTFENRGSDCFVNSVLWSLMNLSVGQNIKDGDPAYPFCFEFSIIWECDRAIRQSGARVRSLFPRFDDGRQHCASEFYEFVVDACPPNIRTRMTVNEVCSVECTECLQTRQTTTPTYVLRPHIPSSNKFTEMIANMTGTNNDRVRCDTCDRATPSTVTVTYDCQYTDVLVLHLEKTEGQQQLEIKLNNRTNPLRAFGFDWILMGGIEHMSPNNNINCGHYKSWIKSGLQWVVLDDQKNGHSTFSAFKRNHKGIRLMFFEKC